MRPQLRRASFRKWLRGQPTSVCVGRMRDCDDCPLAVFLRAQGAPCARVTLFGYQIGPGKAPKRPTPRWAHRFVIAVDHLNGIVTAGMALAVLETLE